MALLLLLTFLLLANCFQDLKFDAQLIPQSEVKSLQTISNKLKNTYWKNISRTSCIDGDRSFNHYFAPLIFSNVTCNCSYNQGTICHVTSIQLKGLNLTGVVPEEFGNLRELQAIDVAINKLYGAIPKSLSRIPLITLSLYGNQLSGTIPNELGQITTLELLLLEDNILGGTLPASLGNLKNLKLLVLAGNSFTGTIPESYAKLKNLLHFRVNGNKIYGKIPDFIGNLTRLTNLDLQGTSMVGPIPTSLSFMTNLTILRISDLNTANVTFPNLRNLKNLEFLVLRNCFITGSIPTYIENLKFLKELDLSYNQLTGHIPDTMQALQKLRYLFLTNNSLSGPVPNWILNSKQNFDVSYNNFTCSSLASCQQQSNVNLVASCSYEKNHSDNWCMMKDLPCSSGTKYHSLFINCGGGKISFDGNEYVEDTSPGGSSTFFTSQQKWAYSSTGFFLHNINANFLALDTSKPNNETNIYQTARLAPISLKYFGLCLQQGSYNVKLHFAEIIFTNDNTFSDVGRRIFDVAIQGTMVLKDFNIAEEAGGVRKAITKEFRSVYVNGSTLEIHLYWPGKGTTVVPDLYGPLISGITVTPNYKTATGLLSAGTIGGIVVASCVVFILVLVILWMAGFLGGQNHGNEEFQGLGTGYFSLKQIKTATNNFCIKNKLGEGGFGSVYKGVLPDGKAIAVKQLSSKSKQGNREFVNEIGMISGIQHPNLVKLYGCCVERKELLLVYEYMENNSLSHALFGQEEQNLKLDWQTRKAICLAVAEGLAYLHEESRLKIIHRDIKATNVLLDKDLNAKISDFGLAKLVDEENSHISTRVAGTIGYMAPEYAMRGCLTDKADVYSFGVVVLEIVSGKSNTSYRPKEDFVYLLDWACVLQEQGNILEVVDPNLGSNYSEEEALRLLNLALLCTNPSPTLRPTMSSVVSMIDGELQGQPHVPKHTETNEELKLKAPLDGKPHDIQTRVTRRSLSSDAQMSLSHDRQTREIRKLFSSNA